MVPHISSPAGDHTLQELFTGLYATPSAPLPFLEAVVVRSYLLATQQGTVIIYNSPGITAASAEIANFEQPLRLFINHYHETMYGRPELEVSVSVHEYDRAGIERSMQVAGVFTVREHVGADLEVIPSYSHTAGSTFFLWNSGAHRFLFPGDAIWVDSGIWKAVILEESNPQAFLATLSVMRELDFDVLVPWHAPQDVLPYDVVTPEQKHRQIDRLSARIAAGASGPRA